MQDGYSGHYFFSTAVVYSEKRMPTQEQVAQFQKAIKKAAKRAGFDFHFHLLRDDPSEVLKLLKFRDLAVALGAQLDVEGAYTPDPDSARILRAALK